MPRLAVIGDLHFSIRRLDTVLEAIASEGPDVVLLVGDLGAEVDLEATARAALEEVASLGVPVAFVPGNHDLPDIPDQPGALNADHRVVTVAGLRVWGIGGAGPNRWGFPYEWTEGMLRQRHRHRADILLAHCPPKGCTLDRVLDGATAGSTAMRELLAEGQVELMLCGHIHEAPGCELVEGVVCVNAGALGVPFGAPQYVVVDWEPDRIDLRHVVLPYQRSPETAAWCRGMIGGPEIGTQRWCFPRGGRS